jgi:Ricin-type beta-trefoil lectin domain
MAGKLIRAAAGESDDRGSIVMAMLLIMVGTMFTLLLTPIVLAQINTSKVDVRRGHSLDAAQAGVDVALGHIRDANDGSGLGVLASLPCNTFTGTVASGGHARYEAKVYYFSQDPRGHADWLTDSTKQIGCISSTSGLPITPRYALVVSRGTDAATGSLNTVPTRTVQATYVFKTQNNNVPGGLIHSYDSSPDLCLDAGSSSPAVGTVVTFQPCASGTDQQLWSFNPNLTISLATSADTATGGLGLCLDATFPHASNEPITLQTCASTTVRNQQWSFTGNNNFPATTTSGAQDSYCWNPQSTNTVGANLILGPCGGRDIAHAFVPEAAVGAGNADASQKFVVNYNQFGRCLDITNQTLPQVPSIKYLISYPCKVTPDTSRPPTNQQWNMPTIPTGGTSASGIITSVMDPSYCLISPMALGGYPYMDKCGNAPSTESKTWTVWGATGEYATGYRISDSSTPTPGSSLGYCLQPTDPTISPPDLYPGDRSSSKIIMTTCSGATLQKWNAPPGVESAPVKDYSEK